MTTKHTPGPWKVLANPVWKGKHPCHDARYITTSESVECYKSPLEPDEDGGWRFSDPDSVIICTMPDSENQKANARLIAAAPDLLEACKAVRDSMKSAPVLETDWKLPGSYSAWKACVNAIAKAEGREG